MSRQKKKSKPTNTPALKTGKIKIATITGLEQFGQWLRANRPQISSRAGIIGGTNRQNNKRERIKTRQKDKQYAMRSLDTD